MSTTHLPAGEGRRYTMICGGRTLATLEVVGDAARLLAMTTGAGAGAAGSGPRAQ